MRSHPIQPNNHTNNALEKNNRSYFETEAWNGIPGQWWFGGGTDITPNWVVEEDMRHFHGTYKAVCDRHDPAYYPKFKKWCAALGCLWAVPFGPFVFRAFF